jgi:hypothetical protein
VKDLSGQADAEEIQNAKKSESPNNDNKAADTVPKLEVGGVGGNQDATSSNFPAPVVNFQGPIEKDFGTLVISEEGRSRYVNHNFWARVTEEVAVPLLYHACKVLTQT